ncbi:MAG: hypothetical protein ABIP63_05130 [Thermoanaerobaculia bacterium]
MNDRSSLPGRVASWLIFAAILAGGFEPFYLRALTGGPVASPAQLTELPYRKLPGFRRLLETAAARTPPGARIAIALPFQQWEGGYGYGYYRASYLLPGRQVVPLLVPGEDRPALGNLRQADYVLSWRSATALPGFVAIWRSDDGTLLRRIR